MPNQLCNYVCFWVFNEKVSQICILVNKEFVLNVVFIIDGNQLDDYIQFAEKATLFVWIKVCCLHYIERIFLCVNKFNSFNIDNILISKYGQQKQAYN